MTELIYPYIFQWFVTGILKYKRINTLLPYLLVIVIPDISVLRLSLLLHNYRENIERESKTVLPLRYYICLNISAI